MTPVNQPYRRNNALHRELETYLDDADQGSHIECRVRQVLERPRRPEIDVSEKIVLPNAKSGTFSHRSIIVYGYESFTVTEFFVSDIGMYCAREVCTSRKAIGRPLQYDVRVAAVLRINVKRHLSIILKLGQLFD